jgi:hypothetical protein
MAETVPEFIIRLIVRAQNQAAGVLTQANGQLEKLTNTTDKNRQAATRSTNANKDQAKSIQDLDERYEKFRGSLQDGVKDYDDTTFALKRYSAEMDAMARKLPAGDADAARLNRQARGADALRKQMEDARKQADANHTADLQRIAEREAAEKDTLSTIDTLRKEAAAQNTVRAKRAQDEAEATRKAQIDASYEEADAIDQMGSAEKRRYLEQESMARSAARQKRVDHAADMKDLNETIAKAREAIPERSSALPQRPVSDIDRSQASLSSRVAPADRSSADSALAKSQIDDAVRIENARIAAELDANRKIEAERTKLANAARRISDQEIADRKRETDAIDKKTQAEINYRRELMETKDKLDDLMKAGAAGTVSPDRFRASANQYGRQLQNVSNKFPAGSDEAVVGEVASRDAKKAVSDLDNGVLRLGKDSKDTRGFLSKMLGLRPVGSQEMVDVMEKFDDVLKRNAVSSVRFVAAMRSMVIIGVLSFMGQLLGAAVALLGALTALASAAVQAGVALGGMAAAGLAQAAPVIGLLAAAWGRVGAVFDAVKQSQKVATSATTDATAAMNKQRDAADAVRLAQEQLASANRSVADANRGLTKAQEQLNQARQDAKDDLEDLTAAERDAELQRQSAQLAQTNAAKALRVAISTGDVSSQASLRIQAAQATNDVGNASRAADRAKTANARVGGNPENLDSVKNGREGVADAQRSVADANRSVADAQRGLDKARRDAIDAGKETSAAATQLQQLIAQLSPAEKRLYDALNKIRDDFKKIFTGPGGIAESITNAFTFGVGRADSMLRDPKLIASAKGLADQISTQLKRVFSALSSPGARSFIAQMTDEATKNLPKVTTLLMNVGKMLANVAKAAAPAFSKFLDFLVQITDKGVKATSTDSGLAKLTKFFDKGEKYAESILKLAGALLSLFGALMGAGASDAGGNAIDRMTTQLDKAGDWIRSHGPEVRQFFQDAVDGAGKVMNAVGSIGKAIFGLFDPKNVKTFSDMISNVLVPVLSNIFGVLALITGAFDSVFGDGATSKIAAWGLSALAINKLLGSLATTVLTLAKNMFELVGAEAAAEAATVLLEAVLSPWFLLAVAIGLAIAALDKKFHFLQPTLNWLKTAFKDVLDWLKTHWPLVVTIISGPFAPITAGIIAIIKNFGKIKGAVTKAFNGVKSALSGPINSIIKTIRGFIKDVTGILPSGFKKAGKGAADGLVDGFKAIGKFFANIGTWLFDHIIKPIYDFLEIKSPSKLFFRMGQNLIQGLIDGVKDMAKIVGSFFLGVGKVIVNAIADGIKKAPGAIKNALGDVIGLASKGIKGGASALGKLVGIGGGGDKDKTPAAPAAPAVGKTVTSTVTSLATLNLDPKGMSDYLKSWQDFWKKMAGTSDDGTSSIEKQFRDMRVNSTASADRMYRDIRGSLSDIQKSFDVRGQAASDSWSDTINDIQSIAYKGFDYVGHQTNLLLKALGSKNLNFGLIAPKADKPKGKAEGGWIGNQGERGADLVPTVLGRGEAVLNWAHQKAVAPALAFAKRAGRSAYGSLGEVFKGVKGEHAGASPGGFASGGAVGGKLPHFDGHPENVSGPIRSLITMMERKWPKLQVTSTTDHSLLSSSGGVSFHTQGKAVDLASSDYPYMNQVAAWIKSSGLYKKLAEGIHNPNLAVKYGKLVDGPSFYSAGGVWGQHLNHIHMALTDAIGNFVAGGTGSTKVKHQTVGGPKGGMKSIVQGAIDKVTKSANKKLSKEQSKTTGEDDSGLGGSGKPGPGQLSNEAVRSIIIQAEKILKIPASVRPLWTKMAQRQAFRESSNTPGAGQGIIDVNSFNGSGGAKGLFQTIDQTFQSNKVKGHNNIWNGLDNALAAFNYMRANYGGGDWSRAAQVMWDRGGIGYKGGGFVEAVSKMMGGAFANGGVVPGAAGKPVPILAHAKEWILNEGQQHKIAGWMGTTKDKVQGALGFGHNQKTSAATGTKVSAGGLDSVVPTAGSVYSTTPSFLTSLSKRAEDWMKKLQSRSKTFMDSYSKGFERLAGDDGLLAQLTQAITDRADKMARALATSTYKINQKTGSITKRLSDVDISQKTLDNLVSTYKDLVGQKGVIQKSLNDVTDRIDKIKKGGISKDERDDYNQLVGYQRKLKTDLGALDDSINANVQARYEQVTTTISAMTDAASKTATSATAKLDIADRFRTLIGGTALGVPNAEGIGQQRAGILNTQAASLTKARDYATKQGHGDEAKDLQDQIDDLHTQAVEAVAAGLQSDVDEITRQSARRTATADFKSRVGTALGRVDMVAQANADKMAENGNLIAQLQVKQQDAASKGFGAMAEAIGDQISELQTSSTELAATMLSNAVDQVNAAATRRGAALDLQNRRSDLVEKAGNSDLAFAQRGQTLQDRGQSLADQRTGLQQLQLQAMMQGNQGQVDALGDQIADLSVSIDENTAAIASNTVAARQARIDAITSRNSFQTGAFGNLSGILDALGSLTGVTDIPGKIQLAQNAGNVLRQTGSGLAGQLSDLTGGAVNLAGLSPQQLVATLSSMNFDQQESGFNVEQKKQFEDLINAVIDNASALVSNTDQLKNLTGTTTQTWSSAAWQWFRQAVYNGNGGLLAQYQNPSLGIVNPSGMYSSQTASAINSGAMSSAGSSVTNNVTNEERTVDMDAETLANKLYFRQTTGARS